MTKLSFQKAKFLSDIILNTWKYNVCSIEQNCRQKCCVCIEFRLRAIKGPAPPLGNFADISYLEENFKPHLLRDVCTLCSGVLVSDSLLHMLLQQTKGKNQNESLSYR